MKREELIRHLERNNGVLLREGSGHSVYMNKSKQKRAAVLRHREIASETGAVIGRELGIVQIGKQ